LNSPGVERIIVIEDRYIDDFARYNLRRPRDGQAYLIRNNEVFLVNRATQEVIEGLGALSYLLGQ
jgi:Ni/Co efflux regulator RcnB